MSGGLTLNFLGDTGNLVKSEIYIGGGTRGAGGAMAPADFKIYAFGPPRFQNQKLTNSGWKSLLSMYYSFSSVIFMRFFARSLCIAT